MSARPRHTGLKRIYKATIYSLEGLRSAWKSEEAFRQEVLLAAVLIPLGFYLGETPIEKILLVCSILLILIVELLNSAVEAVVDRLGFEYHELSKNAKDMGSAAVFLCWAVIGTTWGLILLV